MHIQALTFDYVKCSFFCSADRKSLKIQAYSKSYFFYFVEYSVIFAMLIKNLLIASIFNLSLLILSNIELFFAVLTWRLRNSTIFKPLFFVLSDIQSFFAVLTWNLRKCKLVHSLIFKFVQYSVTFAVLITNLPNASIFKLSLWISSNIQLFLQCWPEVFEIWPFSSPYF